MKLLAVILARGGSKRLPRKNLLPIGGVPLIGRAIKVAQNIPEIVDVLVSTDDNEIAMVSESYGAFVPWLRPGIYSQDDSPSIDAILHAVEWYQQNVSRIDGVLLLQPTSPFRTQNTLKSGIKLYEQSNMKTVIGVSPAKTHPMWVFKLNNQILERYIPDTNITLRSQDLDLVYEVNGAFYLISTEDLINYKSFYVKQMVPLIMDIEEGWDIDDELDYLLAEKIFEIRSND